MSTETALKKLKYNSISDPPFKDCQSALVFLDRGSYKIESLYHVNDLEPNPELQKEAKDRGVSSEETVDIANYPPGFSGSLFHMRSWMCGSTTGLGLDKNGNWRMILYKEVE